MAQHISPNHQNIMNQISGSIKHCQQISHIKKVNGLHPSKGGTNESDRAIDLANQAAKKNYTLNA